MGSATITTLRGILRGFCPQPRGSPRGSTSANAGFGGPIEAEHHIGHLAARHARFVVSLSSKNLLLSVRCGADSVEHARCHQTRSWCCLATFAHTVRARCETELRMGNGYKPHTQTYTAVTPPFRSSTAVREAGNPKARNSKVCSRRPAGIVSFIRLSDLSRW